MIFFQNLVESLKLRRPPRPRSSLLRLVKEFHEGWLVGEVTDIFVSGGMKKIRRCTYSDGDAEDLTLSDLKACEVVEEIQAERRVSGSCWCMGETARPALSMQRMTRIRG